MKVFFCCHTAAVVLAENGRVIRLQRNGTYAEPWDIFGPLIHLVDYYYMISGRKSVFCFCAEDKDVSVHGYVSYRLQ